LRNRLVPAAPPSGWNGNLSERLHHEHQNLRRQSALLHR
jgi:hypothetical protein